MQAAAMKDGSGERLSAYLRAYPPTVLHNHGYPELPLPPSPA